MLTRQLASAGSGKTYTLARQYIRFLISIKEDDKPRRLRTGKELADAASHILAITFTNKATSEMKERIVDKLADLANSKGSDDVDYMKEFMKEFNASAETINETCKTALDHLLNDFSKFNVSTIDSFFQSVLRTFAYETDLNDNYGVEIGTETLSSLAIESMFNSMSARSKDSTDTEPIVSLLMDLNRQKNKSGWNLFQRRENSNSAYSEVLDALRNIDNDRFRDYYADLNDFFFGENGISLRDLYFRLRELSEKPVSEAWKNVHSAATELRNIFIDNQLDVTVHGRAYMHTHVRLGCISDWRDVLGDITKKKIPVAADIKTFYSSKFSKKLSADIALTDAVSAAGTKFYDALNYFKELTENKQGAFYYWNLYKDNLPLLGMLLLVNRYIREYTSEHNLVQLGDTNLILSRIIAEDDTPFIYERLGARLDHFLIDEFQDTSRMQWRNMLPLLYESESRDNENLIIGDAKQSIYRFRNADSSIITDDVPVLFKGRMHDAGNTPADNTNWRSERRIVEFNNLVFHVLSRNLGEEFVRLYCNTVQPPHHTDPKGYVEINFVPATGAQDDEMGSGSSPYAHLKLGEMVTELRKRGYRFRDIAFLVRTNMQGEWVIETLIEYNSSLPPDQEKIRFVSEESLKIDSSVAVRTITDALHSIVSGTPFRTPDFPSASMLSNDSSGSIIDLEALLRSMQSTALPALVEAIAEKCVAPEILRDEAPFIAAFQDEVTVYCESHSADIASFLAWWQERRKKAAISSPEDTDAVNIMTIHKSKGLEFDCVIIPELTADFGRSYSDKWTWVRPENVWGDKITLPPVLPICINSRLTGTVHEDLLKQFTFNNAVDNLNSTYVALTRAVKELYLFLPCPATVNPDKLDMNKLWAQMLSLCRNADEELNDIPEDLRQFMPNKSEISQSDDLRFTFGKKISNVVTDSDEHDSLPIENYHINGSLPLLQFKEEKEYSSVSGTHTSEARDEGTQFHAIMANVITAGDLDKALTKASVTGAVTETWISQNRSFLIKAIESVSDRKWFDPGWRVLTERTIALRNRKNGKMIVKRPDRVMISPQGDAVIIDYKFGDPSPGYRKQIREYASILSKSPGIQSVEGYLWYVAAGIIEKC